MVHLRLASRAEITLAVAELHKAAKCSKRSAKSSKQKTYHRLSERVYKNCDRRECSRLAKGIVWRPEQRLGFEDFQEETSVTLQADIAQSVGDYSSSALVDRVVCGTVESIIESIIDQRESIESIKLNELNTVESV